MNPCLSNTLPYYLLGTRVSKNSSYRYYEVTCASGIQKTISAGHVRALKQVSLGVSGRVKFATRRLQWVPFSHQLPVAVQGFGFGLFNCKVAQHYRNLELQHSNDAGRGLACLVANLTVRISVKAGKDNHCSHRDLSNGNHHRWAVTDVHELVS